MSSDVSVDEDAVPVRKVIANNKVPVFLISFCPRVTVTHLPWSEHLVCSSKETVDVDPQDDLKRETAFYKLALDQIPHARRLAAKHDIPFTRPSDYYAEMVKSDEHMERVRTKLVEEAQGIKKSDAARKQRDLKKFGKQIQVEKLKQREMDKKSFAERMHGIKRKRKDGMELGENGDEDDFKVDIEDAVEGRGPRGGGGDRGGRGGRGASKVSLNLPSFILECLAKLATQNILLEAVAVDQSRTTEIVPMISLVGVAADGADEADGAGGVAAAQGEGPVVEVVLQDEGSRGLASPGGLLGGLELSCSTFTFRKKDADSS
ncbi:MAG: rRNA-processing protein and EBNA1-binding protein ebp2 [Tremellales sp. Tagirdzhanova-0007]|nr:MAG: rRNA-processing protein and EBNA1-binding protein ebp2 [Tremellales sp. Tagirdzhanova-0007]